MEGPGGEPARPSDRLHRHLPVPQPRLLPQARRGGRPVRGRPGGQAPGEDPAHLHHQPPAGRGPRGHRLRAVRHPPVSLQLPLRSPGAGAGGQVPGGGHGLHRHESPGRRPHPGRADGGRLHGDTALRGPHLGRSVRLGAGPVPGLRQKSPGDDGGAPGGHRPGPEGALRGLLPGVRLLHALPRGH